MQECADRPYRNTGVSREGNGAFRGRCGPDHCGHRSPDEVFSEAALASFEGKPVTNDHPPGLIGPDDVKDYEMGHAQNIRGEPVNGRIT